jgi:hypothetical protein
MRLFPSRRIVGVLSVAALATAMLGSVSGTAIAGSTTRFLYVGYDKNALDKQVANADLVGNGQLTFSDVTAGGLTSTNVYIRNIDNQTLTHLVLTIPKVQGTFTVQDDVFGRDGAACTTPVTDATVIRCDYGNLKAGATKAFSLLIAASAEQNTTNDNVAVFLVKIVFNESNNPNGSNTQIQQADGKPVVGAFDCGNTQTFLRAGKSSTVFTCPVGAGKSHSTKIETSAANDTPVTVSDIDTDLCISTLTCFGQGSKADLNVDGSETVRWTVEWTVASNFNTNKLTILHFPDGSTTPDLILTQKKNTCKTDTSTGCIESVSLVGTTLTVIFRTKGNGVGRGGI